MRRWCAKKNPDITGDNGLSRSRGGFGTKIHLVTDAGGLPLNIVLSPGQAHESQFAQRPLDGIGVQRQSGNMKRRGHAVLADKAYSGHAFRNELKRKGIKTVIRKRPARTVLTGMGYSVGSVMRQGSSSLTRLTGQSAMTSSTWRR